VSQTPQHASLSRKYEDGWRAINLLIRSDGSWSGRERKVCYRNLGDGKFQDVSFITGLDFTGDGRSFVTLDLDDDGTLDLALKSRTDPQVRILRNGLSDGNSGAIVELIGVKSNRDAVGARATLVTDRGRRTRFVQSGSGFLSQSSRRLHFGVRKGERVLALEVRWPSGLQQMFDNLPQIGPVRIREGSPAIVRIVAKPSPVAQNSAPIANRTAGTWLSEPVPAPQFSLPAADGKTHSLAQYRGKKVLLNFWATWCPPCRTELADFAANSGKLEAAGVHLLAVSVDEPGERKRLETIVLPFPILLADDHIVAAYTIVNRNLFDRRRDLALPTSFLIDESGEIIKIYQGRTPAESLLADAATRDRAPLPFPGKRYTPEPKRNYTELATAMAERGLKAEARILFEAALKRGQSGFELYNNFAGLLIAEGELSRAEELLRASLRVNSGQVDAHANLGMLLFEQKKPEAAIPYLEHALSVAPDDAASRRSLASARTELGIGHIEAGQPERARAEFLKAVEADPNDAAGHINLALFYLKTGEDALALKSIDKARSLDPNSPAALLLEAEMLLKKGNRAAAKALVEKVLSSHPDSGAARELLKRISGVTP
jgi:Tfp pilus assembly protein PilF/peroxiredoxin